MTASSSRRACIRTASSAGSTLWAAADPKDVLVLANAETPLFTSVRWLRAKQMIPQYKGKSMSKRWMSGLFTRLSSCTKNSRYYLADCVGVLAAEPFFPSSAARCCSSASSKLLGAWNFVRQLQNSLQTQTSIRTQQNPITYKNKPNDTPTMGQQCNDIWLSIVKYLS